MGDFAARAQAREHATPSTAQLARGLDRFRLRTLAALPLALEPVLPVLDPWVQRLGYADSRHYFRRRTW